MNCRALSLFLSLAVSISAVGASASSSSIEKSMEWLQKATKHNQESEGCAAKSCPPKLDSTFITIESIDGFSDGYVAIALLHRGSLGLVENCYGHYCSVRVNADNFAAALKALDESLLLTRSLLSVADLLAEGKSLVSMKRAALESDPTSKWCSVRARPRPKSTSASEFSTLVERPLRADALEWLASYVSSIEKKCVITRVQGVEASVDLYNEMGRLIQSRLTRKQISSPSRLNRLLGRTGSSKARCIELLCEEVRRPNNAKSNSKEN